MPVKTDIEKDFFPPLFIKLDADVKPSSNEACKHIHNEKDLICYLTPFAFSNMSLIILEEINFKICCSSLA